MCSFCFCQCQTMSMVDSVELVNSLQGREEHRELSIMLAQTFLIQNWIKPSDNDAKKVVDLYSL